jgi:hypothetical protein
MLVAVTGATHHGLQRRFRRGAAILELRVEGEPGVLDAGQSLRILAMLAEVATVVAPEGTELLLTELRSTSAVAVIDPTGISSHSLFERVHDAFGHAIQLTRKLRSELVEAFQSRAAYGIAGFGFRHETSSLPFDEGVSRRIETSLSRPTGWASVSGEVRSVGRSQSGLSGKMRDAMNGHVVNFEAPPGMEDELRGVLFRRAALSGECEADDAGFTKRIVVERVEPLAPTRRLSDGDFSGLAFDSEATLAALQELRRG